MNIKNFHGMFNGSDFEGFVWFKIYNELNESIDSIKELWDIVLKERVEGYSHRAAKKKTKPEIVVQTNPDATDTTHIIKNLPLSNHICLVKLSS